MIKALLALIFFISSPSLADNAETASPEFFLALYPDGTELKYEHGQVYLIVFGRAALDLMGVPPDFIFSEANAKARKIQIGDFSCEQKQIPGALGRARLGATLLTNPERYAKIMNSYNTCRMPVVVRSLRDSN